VDTLRAARGGEQCFRHGEKATRSDKRSDIHGARLRAGHGVPPRCECPSSISRSVYLTCSYLQAWINKLKDNDIIPADHRTDFIQQVFWNIHDIIAVNTRLRDALNKRQKSYAVVERIGDILLDAVPHFDPFVSYGAHQLYGKYEFEKEKSSNPAFAAFVEVRPSCPCAD
jgi:hypothetical protein